MYAPTMISTPLVKALISISPGRRDRGRSSGQASSAPNAGTSAAAESGRVFSSSPNAMPASAPYSSGRRSSMVRKTRHPSR